MGTVQDVLRIAAAELGTIEQPVNRQKYSAALGRPPESWCADLAVWVLLQAAVPVPLNTPNASALVNSFLKPQGPEPGDLVGYHFPGEPAGINHVGIVESVSGTSVTSIEGNTTPGTVGVQSNGGGVYRRTRPMSQVVRFGRPSYTVALAPREVSPMFPPITIAGAVVGTLKAANGGVRMLTDVGAVYAWECADHGAPNRHPEYWRAGQKAARIEQLGVDGYTVIDSQGARYDYPG